MNFLLGEFFWNIDTDPSWSKIIRSVQPKITPSIVGIAFLTPKLKAVYDVMILLGPGEKEVAIPNKTMGTNCDNI